MGEIGFRIVCILGLIGSLQPVLATEQVYHPASPAFGGNPLNGSFLLSTAQAQGEGVKSGNQGPDLSGLTAALNNNGTGTNGTNGSTGNTGATGNAIARGSTIAHPLGNAPSAGSMMP
jgi:curli production assembly/transport component CsgF